MIQTFADLQTIVDGFWQKVALGPTLESCVDTAIAEATQAASSLLTN